MLEIDCATAMEPASGGEVRSDVRSRQLLAIVVGLGLGETFFRPQDGHEVTQTQISRHYRAVESSDATRFLQTDNECAGGWTRLWEASGRRSIILHLFVPLLPFQSRGSVYGSELPFFSLSTCKLLLPHNISKVTCCVSQFSTTSFGNSVFEILLNFNFMYFVSSSAAFSLPLELRCPTRAGNV